jgi:energy-coupling factor transporter ATP-binding protein EcfA2
MIRIDSLGFHYPGQVKPALEGLSLVVPEGAFALVTGHSGSGKSTLLRCINGLVPHFSGGRIRGQVRVNGLDPVAATPNVMSRHVGFVFQDPETQFVLDRVEDEIAFALENAAVPRPEMRVRVEEVLDLLELSPLRERRLKTLSSGERQRVAIASALAFRPQIMVLDEPTSQLDPKSAEDVLSALVRLKQDLGLTILLAEHRLERVLPFVDQINHLARGVPGALCGSPQVVLEQIELAPPVVKLAKRLGWHPLPLTVKAAEKFRPTLPSPGIAGRPQPESAERGALIRAQDVRVEYDGQPALRGVDLSLRPGEIVALMGRNGAGKTTLLRCIVGLVQPKGGEVWIAGEKVRGKDVSEICRRVAYLPQDPNALLFAETVTQELEQTLKNHSLPLDWAQIEALLVRLGLREKADAYPRDLSTGERQRVALGAISITGPQGFLLDEPTRGLDYQAKAELGALLSAWREEGMAILLVTHDVEFAASLADRIVLLSQGEIIASGAPAEVLGGSPMFATQIARLFPGQGWLTVEDALRGMKGEV